MTDAALLRMRRLSGVESSMGNVAIRDLVIAGWTARDSVLLEKHIAELAAHGVARPGSVPCFYRASARLLTTAEEVDSLGEHTSGEVEFVLFGLNDGLWVGLGSDHTDRSAERFNVAVSKQACPKPVAPDLWKFSDVAPHWDRLILRSYAVEAGERRLYQEGSVTAMRDPRDLLRRYQGGEGLHLDPGTAMFCGTLPALGPVRGSAGFEMELEDPVLNRKIRHAYRVRVLPLVS